MNANEYQTLALRTINPSLPQLEQLTNGVMGLCGEAGECIDLLKKYRYQGHSELDVTHLAKELGDCAWYLAVSAAVIGYDLEDIFKMNIEKLEARYPEGFDEERSMKRAEGDV